MIITIAFCLIEVEHAADYNRYIILKQLFWWIWRRRKKGRAKSTKCCEFRIFTWDYLSCLPLIIGFSWLFEGAISIEIILKLWIIQNINLKNIISI